MKRALCLALVTLAGCVKTEAPPPAALASYRVTIDGVFQWVNGTRVAVPVVDACAESYGGQDLVPGPQKGTTDCRYIIPRGEIEIDVTAVALGLKGEPLGDYSGSASFRVVPGELTGGYPNRWFAVSQGVGHGTVKSTHQYGRAVVWVEDAPPEMIIDGGVAVGGPDELPPEITARTFATGASAPIAFEDQTLQSLQQPDGFDNRSSPFVGEFVVVGKNPESGETQRQTCAADPERNGQQVLMVVTGIDPSGFFVSDVTACRIQEQTRDSTGATQVRTPELPQPCQVTLTDGGVGPIEGTGQDAGVCGISKKRCTRTSECPSYLPSTYAHMFVYNYSFPEGLNQGDLLFTVSGAVQEFTSTSQMTFPAWSIAEKVRELPIDQWDKWLKLVPPVEITGRICGQDNTAGPFLTDQSCGHNRRNLKMESLESGLVKLRNARFPQQFVNCDFDSSGSVPFFCETKTPDGVWVWSTCNFDGPEAEADRIERECFQNCVMGMGDQQNIICSELSNFTGFGQYVVEMNAPGPSWAGLDDSLSARKQTVTLPDANTSVRNQIPYATSLQVSIVCNTDVHYRVGDALVNASDADAVLPARQVLRYVFTGNENTVAFKGVSSGGSCAVAQNTQARINLLTRDAIPELNPNCRIDDPDLEAAQQCRNLRGSSFDIVGHLRHVQPARPRWMVIPRDVDDVCCHPGPGLSCPKPIKPCSGDNL